MVTSSSEIFHQSPFFHPGPTIKEFASGATTHTPVKLFPTPGLSLLDPAIGWSLTKVILIDTVASLLSSVPSFTLKLKPSLSAVSDVLV